MTPSLTDLIARVERAEGPDRELDEDIARALLPPGGDMSLASALMRRWAAERLTSSLDAALALVEAVLPGWSVQVQVYTNDANACVWSRRSYERGQARTPALALILALLRALESRG